MSLNLYFQNIQCERIARIFEGHNQVVILNIGANDDPGNLKSNFPGVVVNCDRYARDEGDEPHDNDVDVLFDAGREPWPFANDSAALTVFGDILEHLEPEQIDYALLEAHRVGLFCAITSPEDHRLAADYRPAHAHFAEGLAHTTLVSEPFLRNRLMKNGWVPIEWVKASYGFAPGHFVLAVRAEQWDPEQTPAV